MSRPHIPLRPLLWVGSSRKDFKTFPEQVRKGFGFELYLAQTGQHPPSAKRLRGVGGGILELVDEFDGNAWRAVYSIRFSDAVYVLHAFQKKSRKGISTPKADIELVEQRMKVAEKDRRERLELEKKP